jgi:hypothetical protein
MVDLGETPHLSWTNNTSVMIFYEILDIENAYCTQHVSPDFSDTMPFDAQHLKLLFRVEIEPEILHTYDTYDLEVVYVHL